MAAEAANMHASAVLVGTHAVLIRGPGGAGKSQFALALIRAAETGLIPFARLVGDDRVLLQPAHGRLLVRPAPVLAGLIEVRGVGIRRLAHEPVAVVGLVVDLASADGKRLPDVSDREVVLSGIRLPRLGVAPGADPFPMVLAELFTAAAAL